MQSPCTKEASRACFHGCCPAPFLALPPDHLQNPPPKSPHHDFIAATTSSLQPYTQFTNPDSLPPLPDSLSNFNKSYPKFSQTQQADQIRIQQYSHLSLSNHVCLDYVGHGLFSHSQQQQRPHHSDAQFFDILHKPGTLNSQLLYGGDGESEFESRIRKRIMGFMNISEDDYSMVFTANKSSAFRLLADSYPFDSTQKLITVYDHESEAVEGMAQSAAKRGARVRSAEFSWPSLRIQSRKLRKMIVMSKKNKKGKMGLFVFPPQSRMTGARYSYLWMSLAQENCWDVLLDATALGAKDMETLGLSLFKPDFLICSFFKVFGQNPSGIGCLFVKKSSGNSVLNNNSTTSIGIVSLVPSNVSNCSSSAVRDPGPSRTSQTQIEPSDEDCIEIETSGSDLECRGLDHADSLGLILISSRGRFLVNWAVNALMSLRHPHDENGFPLVRIYGPKVRIDRGAVLAFNIFDWRRERVDPELVQKLADRNNISISCGFLCHVWFSDKYGEEREKLLETRSDKEGGNNNNNNSKEEKKKKKKKKKKKNWRGESSSSQPGIYVLSASLGFLTNFEDVYRLWAFVSRFLDADFVEKEKWRYMALNQTTIEV